MAVSDRPRSRRAVGARLAFVAALLAGGASLRADAEPDGSRLAAAFTSTAAASGAVVRIQTPLTTALSTTPVDSGGPTAQVALDSLGSSTGYAAFPDPGQAIISVPGLLSGLLYSRGVPSVPGYPLYIQSDAVSNPEASLGDGPYSLSASSSSSASRADAVGGIESPAGNVGLSHSLASAAVGADSVEVTATSDTQGFTVGPLTIGEVRSTATMTMDATGRVTPTTSIKIDGMRVGTVPVGVDGAGLIAGSTAFALPLDAPLDKLLAGAGISVRLFPAQLTDTAAVAPAVEISMPFAAPSSVGDVSGRATFILGSAVTSLAGSLVDTGAAAPVATTTSGGAGTGPGTPLVTNPSGAVAAQAGRSTGSAPVAAATPSAPAAPSARAGAPAAATAEPEPLRAWDVLGLYVVLGAAASVIMGVGQMIRRTGVRTWVTSSPG